MAEIKTTPRTASPAAFITQVEGEQRRKDCRELVALMREVTGHLPKMWGTSIVGFDRYQYQYASGKAGESLLTGFSPRKQDLVLYLGPGLQNAKLRSRLVLAEPVEHSVAEMRKRQPAR